MRRTVRSIDSAASGCSSRWRSSSSYSIWAGASESGASLSAVSLTTSPVHCSRAWYVVVMPAPKLELLTEQI